ncbi:hypothetical protein ElyMa_002510900 [Elysia marginata]|uniref:Uncharacterized protein n=1 Tax=Elysia marginata TaxID=1093978 RepID=A0AAV4GSV5_9GAST|nr:hypothetical protein ElyMa_002510900 [Elysia marginata]
MDQPVSVSPAQGAKKAASDFVYHTFGRNPKATGIVFIAMVIMLLIFVILFLVFMNKHKNCARGSKSPFYGLRPLGNLNTGSLNPTWQGQMGDAGWGGPMHSTHQPGQSRIRGASAEGDHVLAVAPVDDHAYEAHHPEDADDDETFDRADSVKNMSDEALMRLMNGGA